MSGLPKYDASELMQEADIFLSKQTYRENNLAGHDLAIRLHRKAIDMCHYKATDLSPIIPEMFLLAAKVAFVSTPLNSNIAMASEKDINKSDVSEFELFKNSIDSNKSTHLNVFQN